MNWFIKLFAPKREKAAALLAAKIQNSFNENAIGHEETIASVSEIAYASAQIVTELSQISKDGKIDDAERNTMEKGSVKRLVDKIYDIAGLE